MKNVFWVPWLILAATSSKAQTTAITWSHQIAPLFIATALLVTIRGGAGPFSLLTYEDARGGDNRWLPSLLPVICRPGFPEKGYGDFADERRLTDDQISLIAKWVQSGMAQGDVSAAPPAPRYSETWQYGMPDLILTVEQPFHLAASGTDVFRNFVLPYPLKQTHYIRAMEIHPAVPRIVHHANLLIDRTASFRRQHPAQWKEGVPGMELEVDTGNEFDPDSNFLFWKPDTPVLVELRDALEARSGQ